jgi:hypothetical protein
MVIFIKEWEKALGGLKLIWIDFQKDVGSSRMHKRYMKKMPAEVNRRGEQVFESEQNM